MTIKQLADQEGISKAGVRHILQQLGILDQVERDEAGVLQLSDEQADAVHAWRQRKAEPESGAGTDRRPESTGREAEPDSNRTAAESDRAEVGSTAESDTDRLLALLEQDLASMREQLAVKDEQIRNLQEQLDRKDDLIDTLGAALKQSTGTTLADSGVKLLEADNQRPGRLRRVWDALRGR